MVQRTLLSLLAALAALLPLHPSGGALPPHQMAIEGQVLVERGNQMPGPGKAVQRPGAGMTVIAIRGNLSPLQPGQPFLPANALKAPILGRARSDSHGRFRLTLARPKTEPTQATREGTRPRITLLLAVAGGYYLNRFDAQGQFASISLPLGPEQPPILLRDDRGATF